MFSDKVIGHILRFPRFGKSKMGRFSDEKGQEFSYGRILVEIFSNNQRVYKRY